VRHKKADKKLNRSYSARKALLRDIARSVILHQSIKTTQAKAKEARRLVDRLISFGKKSDLNSRRKAFKELCDHHIVGILFNDIAPRFSKMNGGYTRILPWLNRRGDNAKMVILELGVKKEKKKVKKMPSSEEKIKNIAPEEKVKEKTKKKTTQKKEVTTKKKDIVEQKAPSVLKEKVSIKEEKPVDKKISPTIETPIKDKQKEKEKERPKKFFDGLRRFLKKERDSS